MRRLLALAAALTVAAGPLAAGGQASAKDHRDGPRGEQRGGEPRGGDGRYGGRGGAPPGWRGGEGPPGQMRGYEGQGQGRWERGDPRGDPRYEQRYDPRYEQRYEPRYDPRNDPRYDPRYGERGAYAPSYGTPRRGGYLGPQGGAPIEDPGRFGLRDAPRGYVWVRVPGGSALVSQSTGQVFDVVRDGR